MEQASRPPDNHDSPDGVDREAVEFLERELSTSWSFPDAKRGSRIIAFVIDALILGAIGGLLKAAVGATLQACGDLLPLALATSEFETAVQSILRAIFSVLYFVWFEYKSGQTPGKKLVGLRVVSASPGDPAATFGRGLPLGRLILRETVGRVLSALPFAYGYFRILFRNDRRGWHDQIGQTRVVSISESESFPIRFKHVAMAGAAIAVAAVGVRVYIIFYTPYPLRNIAKALEKSGVALDHLTGNLNNGYQVGHASQSTGDYRVDLDGIGFQFNEGEGNGLEIKDLVIQSARIELKKLPQLADPAAPPAVHKHDPSLGAFALMARTISVESLVVKLPDGRGYQMNNVSLSGLQYKKAEQTIAFERLWMENETFLSDLHNVEVRSNRLKVGASSYVQLKPALAPDVITTPIDLQFTGQVEGNRITGLDLDGFSRKLHVHLVGDNGDVTVSGLTPLHYFKTDLPIWNLDFRIAGDLRNMKFKELKGSLGLRNIKFEVDELAFVRQGLGSVKFSLSPKMPNDWRAALAGREPVLTLSSSENFKVRDLLAELFFNRPVLKLTPGELANIDLDARFLADAPGAINAPVAPPPAPIPVVVAPVPKKQKRLPTSAGRPKNKMPTVLPPYKVKH